MPEPPQFAELHVMFARQLRYPHYFLHVCIDLILNVYTFPPYYAKDSWSGQSHPDPTFPLPPRHGPILFIQLYTSPLCGLLINIAKH